jgi:tetratricopeptide (TPR) repeat protein
LQSLAHLARDRGDYAEADRLYRDVIARREKRHTANHLQVAETKAYLAWMTFHRPWSSEGPQFNQARLAEAERLLREVLKVREAHLPKNHRDIGYTLAALASIKLGQPKQELFALAYVARAAEVFRHSEQDTFFGNAVVELVRAEQHRNAGRYDQAEAAYLKVLELFRRQLGNRHPLVMLQMGNLAGLYRKKGDLVRAEKTAREFLELVRPMPAFRSQAIVVDGLTQYADEVRRRRSPVEAESLYREALLYARERPQGNEKNIQNLEKRLMELDRKGQPPK